MKVTLGKNWQKKKRYTRKVSLKFVFLFVIYSNCVILIPFFSKNMKILIGNFFAALILQYFYFRFDLKTFTKKCSRTAAVHIGKFSIQKYCCG